MRRRDPFDNVKRSITPTTERFLFGRVFKHHAGFHRPAPSPWNSPIHRRMKSKKVIYADVAMKAAWRSAKFRKFICDSSDNRFSGTGLRCLLSQVGKCFHVEHRANNWHKELVEPHPFIDAQRLKKRFVEQRY